MPALKLLNLLALASVAVLALSSVQVNALVADHAQVARGHDAVAKRKRSDTSGSSCKPRTTSSLPPSPTSAPATTTPATTTPATTTSSAAPASTAGSSSTSSGPKWGLAWGDNDDYLNNFSVFPNVGYAYTWGEVIPSPLPTGVIGIPMLWGYTNAAAFQAKATQGYASYALGMNEPNEPSQANMSGEEGANMWIQYMNPLRALGYHLISPACTNDDAGKQWYTDFFGNCSGACYVDSMAFHAYTTNATDLIDYATYLYDSYGMDVWITEFADQDYSGTVAQATMDEVWNFAGTVVNFVENTSWVKAFPFGLLTEDDLIKVNVNTDNSLIDSNGIPTALADYYFGPQS